uniref:Protein phosphatase 1, regulatory subunit 36 n=1 Tax=Rattus norvegicus TaxID=10116 RepID=A0A8I6A4S6_RAT
MYKGETLFSIPELYPRRKQFVGQSSTRLDQCGLRLGMWYWKDETKSLEFRRLTDKRFVPRDEKSAKTLEKRGQQGNVTLDDVKFVALLSLQDTEMQRVCSFTTFMRNKSLDSFLMALLYYLSYYLERLSMEKKPQSYMVTVYFQSNLSV